MSLSSLDIRMENLEVPESPFKFDGSQRLTSSDECLNITEETFEKWEQSLKLELLPKLIDETISVERRFARAFASLAHIKINGIIADPMRVKEKFFAAFELLRGVSSGPSLHERCRCMSSLANILIDKKERDALDCVVAEVIGYSGVLIRYEIDRCLRWLTDEMDNVKRQRMFDQARPPPRMNNNLGGGGGEEEEKDDGKKKQPGRHNLDCGRRISFSNLWTRIIGLHLLLTDSLSLIPRHPAPAVMVHACARALLNEDLRHLGDFAVTCIALHNAQWESSDSDFDHSDNGVHLSYSDLSQLMRACGWEERGENFDTYVLDEQDWRLAQRLGAVINGSWAWFLGGGGGGGGFPFCPRTPSAEEGGEGLTQSSRAAYHQLAGTRGGGGGGGEGGRKALKPNSQWIRHVSSSTASSMSAPHRSSSSSIPWGSTGIRCVPPARTVER